MPKVFISYSHKDEDWKNRLQTQLEVLQMEGLLSVWEDRQIEVGNLWLPEIELALNTSDVAILLISADFLVSKFIRGQEVPRLLERREKEGIRIIPLILKPCPWRKVAWLSALQGSSRDNIELSGLTEHQQDEVLSKLAEKAHDLLQITQAKTPRTIEKAAAEFSLKVDEIESTQTSLTQDSDELHKNHALEILQRSEPYLDALKVVTKNSDATEIINHFSSCEPEAVGKCIVAARRALNKVRFDGLNEPDKHKVYEAVTAVYMLAAMRLVDATASKLGNHVLFVPRNEEIFCAIIATALFGGCLKILPDYESPLPKPEYVFEVYASAAGDFITPSFERAMYAAIYQNNGKVDISTLDSKELNEQEISYLNSRLHTIRAIGDQSLCLVVTAGISADRAVPVSDKFKVPTLFNSNEAAKVLLGMTHEDLIAEIEEFWRQIDQIRNQQRRPKTTTGEQTMPNVQNNFYAPVGNVAQAHGENSIAQAGSGQSATVNNQAGVQLAELTQLLNEEINDHPSEKSRSKLQSHLQTAQAELAKPIPDKNLIEKSITSIKEVGDAIDGGEKIVELCLKALPLLSLLPTVF
jgi:hypothetical protein